MQRFWLPLALTLFLLSFVTLTLAHDTPVQLPIPQSPGEAWNVIEESKVNIDQLLSANLMRDVAGQLANISISLRFLSDHAATETHNQIDHLLGGEADILRASRDADDPLEKTKPVWTQWCKDLAQLEAMYPAQMVKTQVYICPMHPQDRHLDANDKCSVCGMSLVKRHLPASAIYQRPGEQTLKMTATCPPLVVGQVANVTVHFTKADGTPVLLSDLVEMHTKKIHMLINDQSLSDYHHEHPVPTQTPGEYQFTFTPGRPGPYRVWADVVPAVSSVQEYDIADLPAATPPQPIADKETRLSTVVDGRKYDLSFVTNGQPIRACQTIVGTVAVTGADGKPFTQLEPVMGAFAHLVGFSEDGKSVLHIHPFSKQPSGPEDRAGPAFAFKFYAPTAGFLRLYCQVQINGANVFVPFNLNITQ